MIIQFFIQRTDDDINVRMRLLQSLQSFRRCDNAKETDAAAAMCFQSIDRVNGGTAGRAHRIDDENIAMGRDDLISAVLDTLKVDD